MWELVPPGKEEFFMGEGYVERILSSFFKIVLKAVEEFET
jgi:hypothetical protein